jgi:hypothetical protein
MIFGIPQATLSEGSRRRVCNGRDERMMRLAWQIGVIASRKVVKNSFYGKDRCTVVGADPARKEVGRGRRHGRGMPERDFLSDERELP